MTKTTDTQNKHIRKGDKVLITAGNDRGSTGTVLSRTTDRAIVQGINVRKKHVKKSQTDPQGGVRSIECAIHVSKLKLVNDEGKAVKARARVAKDGSREVYYRDGGRDVTIRSIKKSK